MTSTSSSSSSSSLIGTRLHSTLQESNWPGQQSTADVPKAVLCMRLFRSSSSSPK